jgi:hypothetical protein
VRPAAVVDDYLLVNVLGEPRRDHARDEVIAAAGG